MMRLSLVLVLVGCAANAVFAQEKLPPGAKVVKVEARPDKIELKNPFDYRQLLLTGVLESGERIDVTRMAQFTVPEKVAKVSERGQVRPVGDGAGQLQYAVAGQKGVLPV